MAFPKGFMIGAATAAHQVEGNNINSDCWAMEQMEYSMFAEPSLDAVDHYNRFKQDIDLMAEAGLNAFRFGIEWARIQPEASRFDPKEIEHYREVLLYCRKKGISPIVTLHHFSSPKWLIEAGGWEDEKTVEAFAAYCAFVVKELGSLMEYVCTINEANMGLQMAKIIRDMTVQITPQAQVGVHSDIKDIMAKSMESLGEVFGGIEPQRVAFFLNGRSEEGDKLVMRAHEAGRDAIKRICPQLKVGVTLSIFDYQALPGGEEMAHHEQVDDFLHYLPYLQKDDFLGLQNYTRKLIGPQGSLPPPKDAELTEMEYEFYPAALGNVVRFAYEYLKKPILVTENGVATEDDTRRTAFIDEALAGIEACLEEDIPILGYMHWSLLDNFEWQLGYAKHFGLIAVDRPTQTRKPKKSLYHLGTIAKRCSAQN